MAVRYTTFCEAEALTQAAAEFQRQADTGLAAYDKVHDHFGGKPLGPMLVRTLKNLVR